MSMINKQDMLKKAYTAFNNRDLETALSLMQVDVVWPKGSDGGYVHGHEGVREYWTQQWAMIDSQVKPIGFKTHADGRVEVNVHQVVRDLAGNLLSEQMVQHIYTLQDGLVRKMEIRKE